MNESSPIRFMGLLIVVAFITGLIGVSGAYFFSGSKIFIYRYGQLEGTADSVWTGYSIEVLRLILAIVLAAVALVPGFRDTLRDVLGFSSDRSGISQVRVPIVLCLFVVGAGLSAREAAACFSRGEDSHAARTMQWAWEKELVASDNAPQHFDGLHSAYVWYAFYSVVFFGMIAPWLFTISIAAVCGDTWEIFKRYKQLRRAEPASVLKLTAGFRAFLFQRAGRYVDLIGAVSFFYVFEVLVGRFTLSEAGRTSSAVGIALSAASCVILFLVWFAYYAARVSVVERVSATEFEASELDDASDMVKGVLRYRIGGYFIVLAFIVSGPLQSIAQSLRSLVAF